MSEVCPFCGALAPAPEAPPGQEPGTVLCQTCGQERDRAVGPPPCPPPPPSGLPLGPPDLLVDPLAEDADQAGRGPAWEGDQGVFRGLARTTWQMLSRPGLTMTPPARRGLAWPLAYAMILGTFSMAANTGWDMILGASGQGPQAARWLVAFSPLLALLGVWLGAGLYHAMLFILGGAKQGFRATLRVVAYSQAAGVLLILPLVGAFGCMLWDIVILTAGLAAAHGIGRGRALTAVLLPLALLLLLAALAVVVLGISVLSAVLQGSGLAGL